MKREDLEKKFHRELSEKGNLIDYIGMIMEMGVDEEYGDTGDHCEELLDIYVDNASKERCQRVSADFDNYKKRINKQINSIKETSKFETLVKFIEILDDWAFFENVVTDSSNSDIKTGFGLIDRKIKSFLVDVNITEVPTDTSFNEDIHEAMILMDEEKKSGTILKVVSKGYQIGDKIIKYPKVIVQK